MPLSGLNPVPAAIAHGHSPQPGALSLTLSLLLVGALSSLSALTAPSVQAAGAKAAPARAAEPINVEADSFRYEERGQRSVFQGNVILTRGTLTISSQNLDLRQAGDGSQSAEARGKPATFRLVRDASGQEIQGEADRIDYDAAADRLTLTGTAKVRRYQCGSRLSDEIEGASIVYENRSERLLVDGRPSGKSASGTSQGRVRIVIQPRKGGDGSGDTSSPASAADCSQPTPARKR